MPAGGGAVGGTAGAAGCGDTTGSERVRFAVEVGGIERDAAQPLTFTSDQGWEITLSEARVAVGPGYQVPFADRIRHEAGVPVMAVGGIEGVDHANTVLAAGRADLTALARPHLADPYLALHGAAALGYVLACFVVGVFCLKAREVAS